MTTLLERGIAAAQAGQKAEARQILWQILKEDQRNEQAWLWLSSVVNTDEERARCLRSVLTINPNNHMAQLGLAKLGADVRSTPSAAIPEGGSPAYQPTGERRPFRLRTFSTTTPQTMSEQSEGVHQAKTMAMPANQDEFAALRQQAGQPHSASTRSLLTGAARRSKVVRVANQPARPPLVPALIFGTLTVTAIGGLGLMLIIALLT